MEKSCNELTVRKNKLKKAGWQFVDGSWIAPISIEGIAGHKASWIMALESLDFEQLLLKHKLS